MNHNTNLFGNLTLNWFVNFFHPSVRDSNPGINKYQASNTSFSQQMTFPSNFIFPLSNNFFNCAWALKDSIKFYHILHDFFPQLPIPLYLLPCLPPIWPAGIFSSSYATTGNQTHVSSGAPLWGTLIQDALQTEVPWPWPDSLWKAYPKSLFMRVNNQIPSSYHWIESQTVCCQWSYWTEKGWFFSE